MNFLRWSFARLQAQIRSPSFSCKIYLPDFLPTGICVGSANGASVKGLAGREEVKPVYFTPSILVWVACKTVVVSLWWSSSHWVALCLQLWPGCHLLLAFGHPHPPLLDYLAWALSTWLQPDQYITGNDETKPRAT